MSTFCCVGAPSSSTLSDPRRLRMVPSSTTVHERAGHLLADAVAEGGNFLAVEIGFQAVTDGFMQQNAGPSGTEHDGHLTSRRGYRVELHDGLANGFAREMFRRFLVFEKIQTNAPAAARVTALRRRRRLRARGRRRPSEPAAGDRSSSTPSLVATSTWRRLST